MIRTIIAGAAASLSLFAPTTYAATDYPAGYVKCAQIGDTCTMSGTHTVALGKSGSFVYATKTGSFTCTNAAFPSNSYPSSAWCSVGPASSGSSSSSSSSSSSGGSSSGSGSITGATCSSTGSVSVAATIVVNSGTTYDGGCKTFNPTSALGDGSQSESQKPAFRINGGTLKNAILGNNGVDGVHFYGGGTLTNFKWTNVGEDAFTLKESGTINMSAVSGYNGEDKWAQVNATGTINISNCIVDSMGKFLRQNGGTTFKITVNADRCQISNMSEGVFRSDSSSSVAKLTNSRLHNSGTLCIGNWASCTGSGNTNY